MNTTVLESLQLFGVFASLSSVLKSR